MDRRPAVASQEGTGQKILLDGEVAETVSSLHDLDHAAPHKVGRRQTVDAFPRIFNRAFRDIAPFDAKQVGDRLERRRLACAIGPKEGSDAPLGNLERNALEHENDVVVDDLDIVHLEQGVFACHGVTFFFGNLHPLTARPRPPSHNRVA